MSSIKEKTVSGLIWSFIDIFSNQGITFIVGIILARLLSPYEFGLIGMIIIFIAVSESIVNSGFSNALIRKNNCTEVDYSTVFYFNLFVGIIIFLFLFLSAPLIAKFFNEPQLKNIIRVFGIIIIIDALSLIQRTILIKRVDFKLQTKISLIGTVTSGIIALSFAYNGFGVWSLVFQRLSSRSINTLLLWLWNNWIPLKVFSIESFKELFGFGSKLLLSGLLDTLFNNIYYLVIGKYFSAQNLGYFTRSQEFANIPSLGITGIISRVTYPVLSSLQDDKVALKRNYKMLIRSTMFVTFILMLGMAAIAESMVITLIGEKWRDSIIYLQLLCFVGMLYPLHALNLNMLQVSGRSDLFLKLEIIKKIIAIPIIVIGIFYGVKVMIIGMIISSLISFYLNSFWSGRFINYAMKEQLNDILPSFFFAITTGVIIYFIGFSLNTSIQLILFIQLISGTILVFLFAETLKQKEYIFLKGILFEKLSLKKRRN